MRNEANSSLEPEISFRPYFEILLKHKMILALVFFLVFLSGVAYLQLSPKMYLISMMVQAPTLETDLPSVETDLSGKSNLETAENIKYLILSNFFSTELAKRVKSDLTAQELNFAVEIPQKTNVLKINIVLSEDKKELGVVLLRNLSDLISEYYARRINGKIMGIANQIKQNEEAIENSKERIKNLQNQESAIILRRDKLAEEIKAVTANTEEMLSRREELSKKGDGTENITILFLSNIIQSNFTFASQLNSQLSDLSIRIMGLPLEIKTINSQINDLQMAINKLKVSKEFISSLKVIDQPKISPSPVSPDKKKILALSMFIGLFLGVAAVFAKEFWLKETSVKAKK